MKTAQLFSLLLFLLAFVSCDKDERLRVDNESEVISDLPGFWNLKEVQLQAVDDFYTKEAGIFNDTTLFDFGIVEYGTFFIDTISPTNPIEKLASNINFQIDDLDFSARVNSVICRADNCTLSFSSVQNSPNWDTQQGQFIQNIFLFDENYNINFIDINNVELTALDKPQRAVQKIILERR